MRSINTSGYRGVAFNTKANKWSVRIGLNNRRIFIGYFIDLEEAARAYDKAAIEYHGKFAQLNFPKECIY